MSTETICAPDKPELKQPPLYKVMLFDDDISTFQCVIDILVSYFNINEDAAYGLAMDVHLIGTAIAGVYPKDTAETKISLAKAKLKENGCPLRIELFESM